MRQLSAQNTLEGINERILVARGVNAEQVCDAPQRIIGASGVDLRAAQLSVGLPLQALTKHSFTWRPRVRPMVLLTPRDTHIWEQQSIAGGFDRLRFTRAIRCVEMDSPSAFDARHRRRSVASMVACAIAPLTHAASGSRPARIETHSPQPVTSCPA